MLNVDVNASPGERGASQNSSRSGGGLAYQPALDGIRALAIIAVLFYHDYIGWAAGGFLGVEAFFVLSGFLITSLLVAEFEKRSTIALGQFWARRARRLLPALFFVVTAVGLYQVIGGPSKAVPDLLGDGLATLFYVGNWHQIWTGAGYFNNTALPSPLMHTWSLAIEEQFYLIWPLVVFGILMVARRIWPARQGVGVRVVTAVAVIGCVVSAIEMAVLYHHGVGVNRVYYGTDTRAQGLLAGAALACGLAAWSRRRGGAEVSKRWRVVLGVLGVGGAGGVLFGMHLAGADAGTSAGLYRGGFLAFDVVAVCLIASVVLAPKGPMGWLFSTWPLRMIGKISYGLYLWHYPLFLWLTDQSTGLSGWELFPVRCGATLAVSTASYFLIESPIRQRRWPSLLVRSLSLPAVGGAVAVLLVASNVSAASGLGPQNFVPTTLAPGVTTTTPVAPAGAVSWAGDQPGCKVKMPSIFLVQTTYHTCPPVHVILMGDSIALTLGEGLGDNEEAYGIDQADDAQLGCSFGVRGLGDWSGTGFFSQYSPCVTQFQTWRQQSLQFHAQAIVVEMGYWDCFDRLWSGQDVHIGEAAFDSYVYSRMVQFVNIDGAGGIPIVVLSVPWVDPAPFANGSPAPSASATRHYEINDMLAKLAAQFPSQVHYVDIDRWVAPGNKFAWKLNGHECRWSDGIHIYPYCGALVEPHLWPLVRQLVEARGGPGPSGAVVGTKAGAKASGSAG